MANDNTSAHLCENYAYQIEVAARYDRWMELAYQVRRLQLSLEPMRLPDYDVWDWEGVSK